MTVEDPEPLSDQGVVDPVPASERAFYVDLFADDSIVVSLAAPSELELGSLARACRALLGGGSRLVLVIGRDRGDEDPVAQLSSILAEGTVWLSGHAGDIDPRWLANLWLAVSDAPTVVVETAMQSRSIVAAELAASLRAVKLVITDVDGGWGLPSRSFADVSTHRSAFASQLAGRQDGAVVTAIETALAAGVESVNLCRAADLDEELFTFDGAGTLFTSGGYVEVEPLRVDDLPAVEDLVVQGVEAGLLKPRSRHEIARLAAGGLGAKVVGSGHLAGIVGLEVDAYRAEGVGEVVGLHTVSRFSGSGAGGSLIDALVERATDQALVAIFAVTVSDAAARFFARKGFEEVTPDRLPRAKWEGYDRARLASLRAFWLDLGPERLF